MDYFPQFSTTATAALAIAVSLFKHVREAHPEDLEDNGCSKLGIVMAHNPDWVLEDVVEYFNDHCHTSEVKPAIELLPGGDWDLECTWDDDDDAEEDIFLTQLKNCIEAALIDTIGYLPPAAELEALTDSHTTRICNANGIDLFH
jgi:hypothetical protein